MQSLRGNERQQNPGDVSLFLDESEPQKALHQGRDYGQGCFTKITLGELGTEAETRKVGTMFEM